MAQGKVKIKEMGLPKGHPEKDGVLVDLKDIVPEVQKRLRAAKEGSAQEDQGLKLVHRDAGVEAVVPETEKAIGDAPAS